MKQEQNNWFQLQAEISNDDRKLANCLTTGSSKTYDDTQRKRQEANPNKNRFKSSYSDSFKPTEKIIIRPCLTVKMKQ